MIPESLRPALDPILAILAELQRRIAGYDATIAQLLAERHPEAERLRQVTGVGPITSAAFVLTIGSRAPGAPHAASWGWTPCQG